MTDQIVFSNSESIASHSVLGKYHKNDTSVTLMPTIPNSRFSEELFFNVKISPVRQNYIFLKLFSTDEYTPIFLYVDGKQLGYAKCGDFEALNLGYGNFSPEGYFFVSTPIPLPYTKGKSDITLSLRCGTPYDNITEVSGRIFEIYSHTQASIPLPPLYVKRSKKPHIEFSYEDFSARYINDQREFFLSSLNRLKNSEKLSITKYVEEMRRFIMILFEPYCPIPDKSVAVDLILSSINSYVEDYFKNPQSLLRTTHQSDWGGYYGELGQSLYLIEPLLNKENFRAYLSTPFNSLLTKKEAWEICLKANFDFASSRQSYIYNQTYYTYEGAWKAMAGLGVIESQYYIGKEKCDLILKEALGIAPWQGEHILTDDKGRILDLYHCLFNHDKNARFTSDFTDIVATGKAVQLMDENGNFVRRKPYGENYFPLTHRALTRENGYVANYGETANYLPEWVYRTFNHGDFVLSDLILKTALENISSRMYMRYQSYDVSSNPVIVMEQAIDERNPTMNPKRAYGAIIDDKRSLLFASLYRHMKEHPERYSSPEWDEYLAYAQNALYALREEADDGYFQPSCDLLLGNFNDFKVDRTVCDIFASPHYIPLPHSDKSDKNFVFFDIDNLLLSLKDGDTHIFAQLNHRNRGYSAFGRAHIIKCGTHLLSSFATDGFFQSHTKHIRSQNVNMDFIADSHGSNSFSRPIASIEEFSATPQALAGEEISVTYQKGVGDVLRENFEVDTPYSGYPDFIWAKIDDYLIIANTTRPSYQNAKDYTLPFSVNGESITLPPFSYKVIKVGDFTLPPASVKVLNVLFHPLGILLSWKTSEGEKYNIYRNGTLIASTDKTYFVDNNVSVGEEYSYFVTTVISGCESSPSPSQVIRAIEKFSFFKFQIGKAGENNFGTGNDYMAQRRNIQDNLTYYASSFISDSSLTSPDSVMIRENLSPSSRYAYIGFENDKIVIRTRSKNTMYTFTEERLSPLCYTFEKKDYTHVKISVEFDLHSVLFFAIGKKGETLLLREFLPFPEAYYFGSLSKDGIVHSKDVINEPFPIKSVAVKDGTLHVQKGLDNKYLTIEASSDGKIFTILSEKVVTQTYPLPERIKYCRITPVDRHNKKGTPIIVKTF